jgi:cation diffusion facilitator family transporter
MVFTPRSPPFSPPGKNRYNSPVLQRFRNIPSAEARAILFSLAVGVLLLVLKFGAWFLTGSAVIFSDAMESIVNVAAAAMALYSLALAHAPADADHPYGHGKIEFVSAAVEGGMILVAAVVIVIQAIKELLVGGGLRVQDFGIGITLMVVALLANGIAGAVLIRIGRRRRSPTLQADGKHLISDMVTSVAALIALVLILLTGQTWIDAAAALLAAGYIGWTGMKLLRQSAAGLMDEQDLADQLLLQSILDGHLFPDGKPPQICSYHKLRHRHTGRYHWVDFHIMVPAWWNIEQGHQAASAIEYEIEQALMEGNATAHVEPCTQADCPHCSEHNRPAV